MNHLSAIYIYPIKSLAGIALKEARLEKRGLANDRRWMLIDQNGRFLSQREIPRMALLKPSLSASHLIIEDTQQQMPPLLLDLNFSETTPLRQVTVWDDQVQALSIGQEADDWFSRALGFSCSLVAMPETSLRQVDLAYAQHGDITSFSDGFPYLLANQNSLEDLNSRLTEPISMIRFRPNLVVSGPPAWAEDHWQSFVIGSFRFRSTKPCARCQIPCIDPDTGLVGKEPSRTMATFRQWNNKIYFGLNACLDRESIHGELPIIRVGDAIEWSSQD